MKATYPLTQALLVVALTGCDGLEPLQTEIFEATSTVLEASNDTPTEPDELGPSEVELDNAVRRALLSDEVVPADNIDVEVDLGVLTLEGTVPHLLAKERAVRLASIVRGIQAVTDRLDVVTPVRRDALIEEDIRTAMLLDPTADSLDAIVRADAQRVTLSGTVDSRTEHQVAERLTKSVRGVRSVDNQMEIVPPPSRPDRELAADIEARMRWDGLIDARMVSVDVQDGAATLTGTIGSLADRTRLITDAWVPGVHAIDASGVKVEDWASRDDIVTPALPIPTDSDAQRALELSLLFDPRINSSTVEASVRSGTASLRGSVANLAAKEAAVSAAGNVVGVRQVDASLEIRGTDIPDETIHSALKQLLNLNPITEGAQLDASVEDGVATLRGEVDSYAVRAEARDIAARVLGIVAVNNDLEVAGSSRPFVPVRLLEPYHPVWTSNWPDSHTGLSAAHATTPELLRERVEDRLASSPFVKADAVRIEVRDGTVSFTGEVGSIAAHDEASKAAFEAGALRIENNLVVR